jgi:hypothetical protein
LKDRPLSVRLGTQARALAEREFDESKIVAAYLEVYRSAGALPDGRIADDEKPCVSAAKVEGSKGRT